jgi:signal recognition particle subunit SRP54
MFDSLTEKLQDAFARLRSKGRLSEQDVKDSMRTIRVALLEADVSLEVVKAFVNTVRDKAVGQDLSGNIRAGDLVIKIVQDELEAMMGESDTAIPYKENGPTVILMSGLQGAGKTTTTGKLALLLSRRDKRKPMLVAADLQRPAAVQQLKTLGKQLGFPVYTEDNSNPIKICKNAILAAEKQGCDLVILDTAGRLHVDEDLMRELKLIHTNTKPDQTYLVCDAMTGQDAVNSAKVFHESIPLSGVILTKLDGDTRGGAALSLRHVTGRPIKFAGMGEQLDKLEEFHPKRMAGRILGMGDVVALVEKAQAHISEADAMEQMQKMMSNQFTMGDFLKQLQMIKKMGSIKDMLGMLPGMGAATKGMEVDDKQFGRFEAIILSMTPQERNNVDILDGSRRRRIAKGCGQSVQELNQFLKQYEMMQKMFSGMGKSGGLLGGMKKMMGRAGGGMMGGLKGLTGMGMPDFESLPKGDMPKEAEALLMGESTDKKKLKAERKALKEKRKRSRGR